MKTTYKHIAILFVLSIMISSCQKDITSEKEGSFNNGVRVRIENSSKTMDEIYSTIFESSSIGTISFSHTQFITQGGSNHRYTQNCFIKSAVSPTYTFLDGGEITLNSITPLEADVNGNYGCDCTPIALEEELATLFGNDVTFDVEGNTSNSIPDFETEFYVPTKLTITSPTIASLTPNASTVGFDAVPQISRYGDLTLNWNADENNENGVAIIINWSGLMIDPEWEDTEEWEELGGMIVNTGGNRKNIVIVDDEGTFTIPEEDFDDIPADALIRIQVIRGNIEILEESSKEYKIFATTEAQTIELWLTD